jgi:hypothetical protein
MNKHADTTFVFCFPTIVKPLMCNSECVIWLAHDVGGQVDTRYEVGHDASDAKVHSFHFLN